MGAIPRATGAIPTPAALMSTCGVPTPSKASADEVAPTAKSEHARSAELKRVLDRIMAPRAQ